MAAHRDPWREGRAVWANLRSWFGDTNDAPLDRSEALEALSDVRRLRHLLDQAELAAVRAARHRGSSWAEIAVGLGIARQSAWERWRDLDEVVPTSVSRPISEPRTIREVEVAAAAKAAAQATAKAAAQATGRSRRPPNVSVPDVVGFSLEEARALLWERKLVPVGPDPDGLPLETSRWPSGLVTDQSPEAGAKVPAGSSVTLWLGRGGSAGVREPRRPSPGPRSLRAMREEPAADPTS